MFLLLSYVKILNVSSDILTPTTLFDVHGKTVKPLFLFFDGTVQYLKGNHVYFATLALTMCLIFNIPLVLIAVHPSRCFHRCLNHFRLQTQALTTFMDVFHGNFKTHPHDCRYFAAIYLLLRIVNLLILSLTRSALYFDLSGYILTFAALLIAVFRPYPNLVQNLLDAILILSGSIASFWYSVNSTALVLDPVHHSRSSLLVIGLLLSVPALYAFFLYLYRMTPKHLITKLEKLSSSHLRRHLFDRELIFQPENADEHVPILRSI